MEQVGTLDDDTVTAKTVNGFKLKLEKERVKKRSLFLDYRLLLCWTPRSPR